MHFCGWPHRKECAESTTWIIKEAVDGFKRRESEVPNRSSTLQRTSVGGPTGRSVQEAQLGLLKILRLNGLFKKGHRVRSEGDTIGEYNQNIVHEILKEFMLFKNKSIIVL